MSAKLIINGVEHPAKVTLDGPIGGDLDICITVDDEMADEWTRHNFKITVDTITLTAVKG